MRSDGQKISIHALREESDDLQDKGFDKTSAFLSTPSARRATGRQLQFGHPVLISIHALREESDGLPLRLRGQAPGISIHALREESDAGGLLP